MEFRKMVMITLYAKQKKRHGCIEQTFGLCGEGEGGMFWENSIKTCILSRVKQITSPSWMHETSARAWCTGRPRGIGWRRRWEGVSGWGTHVNPWLIHVNIWQKRVQYCKVISLQLIKINGKKTCFNLICYSPFSQPLLSISGAKLAKTNRQTRLSGCQAGDIVLHFPVFL